MEFIDVEKWWDYSVLWKTSRHISTQQIIPPTSVLLVTAIPSAPFPVQIPISEPPIRATIRLYHIGLPLAGILRIGITVYFVYDAMIIVVVFVNNSKQTCIHNSDCSYTVPLFSLKVFIRKNARSNGAYSDDSIRGTFIFVRTPTFLIMILIMIVIMILSDYVRI